MFDSVCKNGLSALILSVLCFQASDLIVAQEDTTAEQNPSESSEELLDQRDFSPYLDGKWIGQGISYGPYRETQSPGGLLPTGEELAEDLNLISEHWNLIRMYGSSELAEDVLRIIHERELPLRVMLGAWITPETEPETQTPPGARTAEFSNRKEVMHVIRLVNTYPDEVIAVNVGNETQVFWSDHRTDPEVLLRYIRVVREGTSVPVTTADDFNFWNKPESKLIAKEVDFVVTHIHAMWAGVELPEAMSWTERIYEEVCKNHPEKTVVIGEAGWATQVHDEGEQAKRIKGKAGEEEQRLYYRQFTDWASDQKICTFFFEAFDEPWKGGPHPDEVEKHWGLFHVDRKPKAALSPLENSR